MSKCIFVVLGEEETYYPRDHFEPTHLGNMSKYHVTEEGKVWFLTDSNYWVPSANDDDWHTEYLVPIEKLVDPFAELKQAFAEGAEIEFQCANDTWFMANCPIWDINTTYRIKPVQPHKHAELIAEWIKDPSREVQLKMNDTLWNTVAFPDWTATTYRFKPSKAAIQKEIDEVTLELAQQLKNTVNLETKLTELKEQL